MIPEKYRILMNNEIDGVNTPAERDELELYFVRHPAAREFFQDLQASLVILNEWQEVEPPAGLHGRIMRAVDRRRCERRPTWQELVFGRLRLGYAVSAAVGVMVGLLLHTLIPVPGMGRDLTALDLYRGTSSTEQMLSSGWVAAPAADLAGPGVEGQVHAFRFEDKVLVRLTMRASRDVRLGVGFAPEARLQGVIFGEAEDFDAATGSGTVQLAGIGVCRCEFLVDGLDPDDPAAACLSVEVAETQGEEALVSRKIIWH